ncbi:MAG: DNA polymerase IV [Candidatus Promineifilaceae bacterium]
MIWPRAILHLDMDAFFVNVHILDHPEDGGIPLIVGGRPEERGVVASASYEARRRGVHSAMPAITAVRLCPEVKFVGHNWPRIRECSHRVMEILGEYGPLEKMSVDEAYIDLSSHPDPQTLAGEIRQQVKAETRLPASVGLATSKLVAKVASDYDKPEGNTIVLPGEEAAFLAPLPVRAIWGIGPRTAERLAILSIYTCGELAAADPSEMAAEFGQQAAGMQRRAQGIDNRPVEPDRGPPKSISNEWTFNEDVNDAAVLLARLEKMILSVGRSLRENDLMAQTVYLKFRLADFTTFTRQKTVTVPFDSNEDIRLLAHAIWEENWPPGQRMRLLGIGVSKLSEPQQVQLGFNFG